MTGKEVLTTMIHKKFIAALSLVLTLSAVSANADEADQLYRFADRLRTEELYESAIPQFEKFIKAYPENELVPRAIFRLADCHYRLKQYPQAILYYTELTTKYRNEPVFVQSLLRLGHCKLLTGDYDGAAAAFRNILQQKDLGAEITLPSTFLLGKALYLEKDYEASLEPLKNVAADASAGNDFRNAAIVLAADALLKLNKPKDAAQMLEQNLNVLGTSPERMESLLRLGDAYRMQSDYDQAMKYYEQVTSPELKPAGLEGCARCALMLKHYDTAIQTANELARHYPDSPLVPSALQVAGLASYEKKAYDQALAPLMQLLTKFPKNDFAESAAHKLCWSYYRLGEARRNDLETACRSFIERFPKSSLIGDIYFLQGEANRWGKKYAEAIAAYAKVPQGSPSHSAARFMSAVSLQESGDAAKALQAMEAFVAAFPQDQRVEDALYRMINLKMQLKNYAGAVKTSREYLANYPQGAHAPQVVFQQAESLRAQGEFAAMADACEKLLALAGSTNLKGEAQFWIAKAAHYQGDNLRSQAADEQNPQKAATLLDQAIEKLQKAIRNFAEAQQSGTEKAKEAEEGLAAATYSLGGAQADLAEIEFQAAKDLETEKGRDAAAPKLNHAAELQRTSENTHAQAADRYYSVMMNRPELVANKAAFIWTGAWFQAAGQLNKAINIFQKLIDVYPDSAYADRALNQLGSVYTQLDKPDWEKSEQYFDRLLKKYEEQAKNDPKATMPFLNHAQFGKARALRAQQHYDEAARLLETVLAEVPDTDRLYVQAQVELGYVQAARENIAEAIALFGRVGLVYEDSRLSPEALYWAGKLTVEQAEQEQDSQRIRSGANLWALLLRTYPETQWAADARKGLDQRGFVLDNRNRIKD